jgi:hypothetical protein
MGIRINLEDYLGKTYEKLTITGIQKRNDSRRTFLIASCSCGTKDVLVLPYQLVKAKKSCGCLKEKQPIRNEKFNLIGQVFGNLTVTALSEESRVLKNAKVRLWVCQCSCGNTHSATTSNLKNGNVKSCGCLNHLGHNRKPGDYRSKVYDAWKNAKFRCYDDSYASTEKYKGRGIVMSEEFLHDFEAFYEYIGDPPSQEHTLERIDVNGNYERGNITWTLIEFQARNKTKLRNNTSGVTGVSWQNGKGKIAAVAFWREYDAVKQKSVIKSKSFSVSKYGKELAFELACKARENAITELNEQGYGYSDNHGK